MDGLSGDSTRGQRGQYSGGFTPRPSRITICWRKESISLVQSWIAESYMSMSAAKCTVSNPELTPFPLVFFPWSGSDVGGSSSRSMKLSTYSCCHPFEVAIPFHSFSSWRTVFVGAVREVLTEDTQEPVATLKPPPATDLSFIVWRT